jgi:hypothetical protein
MRGFVPGEELPMRASLLVLATFTMSAVAFAADKADPSSLLRGHFQNGAQAKASNGAVPEVTVDIDPAPQAGWTLWHVHIRTDPESTFDQTWAMQFRREHDGSGALIPYYQLKQDATPKAAAFDPNQWLSLEACALRGAMSGERAEGISEGEPCVAVSMNVGARRALLPVGFTLDATSLHLDMNLRGVRTPIDAKRD